MNPAQVHLALNHFPIIGLFIVLLFLAYGVFSKNTSTLRISLWLLVFIALITIPVFYSGEPAEEIIEETTNVSHKIIHEHEEAGELAFLVMEGLGILAIVGLFMLSRDKLSPGLQYLILGAGIITLLLMARVGKLGGEIMHPETGIELHEEHADH